jgi:hypothetical protein
MVPTGNEFAKTNKDEPIEGEFTLEIVNFAWRHRGKEVQCLAEHLAQYRFRKTWLENFRVAGPMSGWSRSPKKAVSMVDKDR